MVSPMTLANVLLILACSTAAVVWGSVIALREKHGWGYFINTTGLLGFWAAALLPFLPENNLRPAGRSYTSVPSRVSEPNVTYNISYQKVDPQAPDSRVDMTRFYESPFGHR